MENLEKNVEEIATEIATENALTAETGKAVSTGKVVALGIGIGVCAVTVWETAVKPAGKWLIKKVFGKKGKKKDDVTVVGDPKPIPEEPKEETPAEEKKD